MAWVVDTCILLDVLEDDPKFGRSSLDGFAGGGLTIYPVTYREPAPAFEGNLSLQDEFLNSAGIDFRQDWIWEDTLRAHTWSECTRRRRSRLVPKRPLADVLIGEPHLVPEAFEIICKDCADAPVGRYSHAAQAA